MSTATLPPKIDYKKQLRHLYLPSTKSVDMLRVPPMNYLMIDGAGSPETKAFSAAAEALFSVAYTIKFMMKKGEQAIDFVVMPLEGLWWSDDMTSFVTDNKAAWKWTVMIMQPPFVTADIVEQAVEQVRTKKGLAALSKLRFSSFEEGDVAQTLHIGPFSEEGPTVEEVHNTIAEHGLQLDGKHHEIYLSDIRRTAPEKWRTVIRQPWKK